MSTLPSWGESYWQPDHLDSQKKDERDARQTGVHINKLLDKNLDLYH